MKIAAPAPVRDAAACSPEHERLLQALKITREAFAEFAAAAIHDLRGPVNQIGSFLDILLESAPESAEPEVIKYLNEARARVLAVLAGLAEYSGVLSHPYTFEEVDTGSVVEAALDRFVPQLRSGGLAVVYDGLPTVSADDGQLRKVFEHLIDNALKFHGAEAPRVEITAAAAGCEWVFSVRDNGIGIEPAQRGRLFTPFQRLWGDQYPGVGIGLAISRRIIEFHGGRIWLGDALRGGGCSVCFTIPRREFES